MSTHAKPIVSNTLAQLVAKFVGAGLTFVTTAIIIRLVGPGLFGDLTKSLVLIAVAFTAIDFGLNATAVRTLSSTPNPRALMVDVISARLLLSVIAVVIVNILVTVLPGGYTKEITSVFWLGSLAIMFQGVSTSINAWFQYRENYWYTAWATIVGAVIVAGLTYYATLHEPTLANFLLAYTLGYATTAGLSLYFARGVVSITLSPARITRLLKSSSILGAILLASVLAGKLDTIILGIFRSSTEVGEYGFAYRIFDVLLVLPVFIMNAVYPRLVKSTSEEATRLIRRTLPVLGAIGVILATGAWLLAPWILWIRPGLTLSVGVLRLLSYSIPLFFLTAPLMWKLISSRREKVVLRLYLGAALLNGILNIIYIPSHGAAAAAAITGATELYILLALLYHSHYETAA